MAVVILLLVLVALAISVVTWRHLWRARSDLTQRPEGGWLWERPRGEIIRFVLITVPLLVAIFLVVGRLPHSGVGGAVLRVVAALLLLFAVLRIRSRAGG
jgi:hypothetical protein